MGFRIVKLSNLDDEEKKKLQEQQEQRAAATQQSMQQQQQEANRNFNRAYNLAQYEQQHPKQSTWDTVQSLMNDVGNNAKNLILGGANGINSIGQQFNRIVDYGKSFEKFSNAIGNKNVFGGLDTTGLGEKTLSKTQEIRENTGLDQKLEENKQKNNTKIAENIQNTENPILRKTAELAPSIGNMGVGMVASSINPTLGAGYFMGSAAGSYYDDAKERGMNETEALSYSNIMGAMEGATELIGIGNLSKAGKGIKALVSGAGKETVKDATKEVTATTLKDVLKDYGIGIADNMMQEAIIDPIQELTATAVAGKDKANWQGMGQKMLQDGINGGLTSAILGGANLGIQSCTGVIEKINNGQEVSQQEMQQAVKDAGKQLDTSKMITDSVQQQVNKYGQTMQNEQQSENLPINQLQQNQQQNILSANQQQNTQQNILPVNQNLLQNVQNEKTNIQDMQQENNYFQYEKSDNEKINNLRQDVSKYFDNSEQTQNFENMLEKIITDQQDLNIRIQDLGTDENGNIINGKYDNNTITINPNSDRAGEFIAVHELTHAIGTDQMVDMIDKYRKSNAEFDENIKKLIGTYDTKDINEEALADVSGQVLGNQEFINNLRQTNPNIFQKIYSEIKYLWHQFTGYKNQNQFVEDLYYKWTQAYNDMDHDLNNSINYSIEKNDKGKYVKADRQVISGNNPLKWEEQVENYINESIRKNKDVQVITDSGDILTITADTSGKAKFRNIITDKNGKTRHLSNKEFLSKLTAETHIDELAQISNKVNKKTVPDYKNHKFAKDGFDYRSAYFEDLDGQYYKITMSVGKNGDINTIYNIGKMDKKNRSNSSLVAQRPNNNNVVSNEELSSTNNILQQNENVNTSTDNILPENIRNLPEVQERLNQIQNNEDSTPIKKTQAELQSEVDDLSNRYDNLTDKEEDRYYQARYELDAVKNGYDNVRDYLYNREQKNIANEYKENPEYFNRLAKQQETNKAKQQQLQKEIEEATPFKRTQYEIIQKTNPMTEDNNLVWIRSPKDIKTFSEAIEDEESFNWGDYSKEDAQRDLKRNKVTLYSSYPIKNGVFVSTSYQQALDYAGGDRSRVHSKEVSPNKVAWINGDEGQYASTTVAPIKYSKENSTWREYLENNFKAEGTRTNLKDILPTKQNNQANYKDRLIDEINNSYLNENQKKQYIKDLNEQTDYLDKDSYNQLKEIYKEESKLPENTSYKTDDSRKKTYIKYKNDNSDYDFKSVQNALDTIPTNRNGKRTINQWKQVAENIGVEIADKSNDEIEKIAFKSWNDLQPNTKENITRYDNVNHSNVPFQRFTSDDWVNTIYKSVNDVRNNNRNENLDTSQYLVNNDIANNQNINIKKNNKIEQKVNEYAKTIKDNFKSEINIDTDIVNKGNKVPINYKNAKETTIFNKAKELFSTIGKNKFENNNETIYVDNSDIKESIDKTIKNSSQNNKIIENISLFHQLDKIIEKGKEISSQEVDSKGRAKYSNYKYYVSNAYIDGKPSIVEFDTRIKEGTSGKPERHFILERVYDINNKDTSATGTSKEINQFGTEVSSNISIPQNNQNVNISNDLNESNTLKVNLPTREDISQSINLPTRGENVNYNDMQNPGDKKIRKHYKSIIASNNTTAEAKKIAKQLMGTDTYVPETNMGQLTQADARIQSLTPDVALKSLMEDTIDGNKKITSIDIATGERLIQYYSKIGDAENLQNAIQATAMAGTSAGQTVQALSMLNHQTPEGQATWIQRSVNKMNNELARKKGGIITTDEDGNRRVINKNGKDITNKVDLFDLTPEMLEKITSSKNQNEMYDNIDAVYEELGQQVPLSTMEKIDSWRYFSMLANPRTHIRNIVGNVAMGQTQRFKDKLAGGIEDVVGLFDKDMERTKTLKLASEKTKAFAKLDVENADVQSMMELNENKYNPQSRLQNARRTFKSDALENTLGKVFNVNDKLLSGEDALGLKGAYTKALSDYITANKIDTDNITDAQLSKARNYAVEQAKEATFHQYNAIATAINQFSRKNKLTKGVTDAILPFVKTPMNVAKAGIEYNPTGLIKTILYDTVKLRKGDITVNKYIDNLSKGLTGTGIAVLGYALADAGILKASGSDDDKKEKYDENLGKQSYAITIGDKTYSLDWLAPVGIPLFVGAEAFNVGNAKGNEKSSKSTDDDNIFNQKIQSLENLGNAMANSMSPMAEMSMISGLTSALKSYQQDSTQMLGQMGTNAVKSYVNQFVPTALGQIAKTGDDYERSTTSTKSGLIPKAVDQTRLQIMSKIPGLRQKLPTKEDIWGNPQKTDDNIPTRIVNNFINPATVKDISTSKVDEEISKVYDATGESSVLPTTIDKTFTINNQKYRMTNEEYSKYKEAYGQNAYKLLDGLVNSKDYKNLTDDQKKTAIENVYSYVKEQNKVDYAKSVKQEVKTSSLYNTLEDLKKNGQDQSTYLEYYVKTKDIKGEDANKKKMNLLENSNYTDKVKQVIYEDTLKSKEDFNYDVMKSAGININEILDYKQQEFKGDKEDDGTLSGKTVKGSKKDKTIDYLNTMDVTGKQRLLLYAMGGNSLSRSERDSVFNYVEGLDLDLKQREKLYNKFSGFKVYKNGTVKY